MQVPEAVPYIKISICKHLVETKPSELSLEFYKPSVHQDNHSG